MEYIRRGAFKRVGSSLVIKAQRTPFDYGYVVVAAHFVLQRTEGGCGFIPPPTHQNPHLTRKVLTKLIPVLSFPAGVNTTRSFALLAMSQAWNFGKLEMFWWEKSGHRLLAIHPAMRSPLADSFAYFLSSIICLNLFSKCIKLHHNKHSGLRTERKNESHRAVICAIS